MNFKHSSAHRLSCSICAELGSNEDSLLAQLLAGDGIISAIAQRTNNFAVIPSIGALVPGHSLVVPLSHESNVVVSASAMGLTKELFETVDRHLVTLGQSFGKTFLIFEHGSTSFGHSLCSTEHGHLHILPLDQNAIDAVFQKLRKVADLIPFCELEQRAIASQDFIYVGGVDERWSYTPAFFMPAKGIPSQYMRRIVAEVIGIESWNWKTEPSQNFVKLTIASGFDVMRGCVQMDAQHAEQTGMTSQDLPTRSSAPKSRWPA